MMKQPAAHCKMQCVLQAEAGKAAKGFCDDAHHHNKRKPESEYEQEVGITAGNYLIERDLHIERCSYHADLKNDGEYQDLSQGVNSAAHPAEKGRQRQSRSFVLDREIFERPSFYRNPGQV